MQPACPSTIKGSPVFPPPPPTSPSSCPLHPSFLQYLLSHLTHALTYSKSPTFLFLAAAGERTLAEQKIRRGHECYKHTSTPALPLLLASYLSHGSSILSLQDAALPSTSLSHKQVQPMTICCAGRLTHMHTSVQDKSENLFNVLNQTSIHIFSTINGIIYPWLSQLPLYA